MKSNEINYRLRFLKSVSLFKGVNQNTLKRIVSSIVERKIHNKDTIYFAGEKSEKLFIIRYGEAIVRVNEQKSVYLGPGDVLAEVSVITGLSHSSSATASLDSLLYEIDGKKFMELASIDRVLSSNLINLLSDRFRDNIVSRKHSINPRRLILHVKLDSELNFSEEVSQVIKVSDDGLVQKSGLFSSKVFQNLSHEKVLIKLSDLRKKNPILHIKFDSSEMLSMNESIVFQADYIVFYELDLTKNIHEKNRIWSHWKDRIRNYQGRVIRFSKIRSEEKIKTERVLYNKEFLGRYLVGKTRGLTLGGGGARALAHVGLLKVLEKNKIHFDYVSGSSMGAVIGALYARGESANKIEAYVKKFFGSIESPFDPTLPLISFYKGRKMKKMLKEAFGDDRIEDYSIPFVTSAVDLHSGEEYIFDKGPLWEALLCTMSLPAVFPPVFLGEHLLVDGGVLNNVPDNLIRDKGADTILSVNVSPLKDKGLYQLLEDRRETGKSFFRNLWEYIKYPPILKIMGRASMLEGREIVKSKVSRMDLFLHFHLEEFNLFDFRLYKQIIDKGEKEAEKSIGEIRKLFYR
ncbi:MAG: patatin-like phospholipase family protein [Leptospiraceae bacterium]|nr:patatin-like phospholipase family protein [Leptospiraceae bacterium]